MSKWRCQRSRPTRRTSEHAGTRDLKGVPGISSGRAHGVNRSTRRTVVVAGLANIAIAVTKLAAGIAVGSAAKLAEAAHSVADTLNQGFLLTSLHRSDRPADPMPSPRPADDAARPRGPHRWGEGRLHRRHQRRPRGGPRRRRRQKAAGTSAHRPARLPRPHAAVRLVLILVLISARHRRCTGTTPPTTLFGVV